jgi:hypothetical protein
MGMLTLLGGIYSIASFIHFAHNAFYLSEYPNLPAFLTSRGVWGAWCLIVALGAIGFLRVRRHKTSGLLFILAYALLGFGGFEHYLVAPLSAHSLVMNVTIWFEAMSAAALSAYAIYSLYLSTRTPARTLSVPRVPG